MMKRITKLILLVALCVTSSCSPQQEMLDLPLGTIDISDFVDGTYPGYYELHRWFCKVEVEVSNQHIDTINVLRSANGGRKFYGELIEKVVESQSLQIDAVSGGTISSKAFLKAVENALE